MEYENRIVRPNSTNVLAKVIDGEAILINVSTGAYYSLNGIGGLIWQWIEKEKSLQKMVFELTRDFDVEIKTAVPDIQHLLETLVKEGLVSTAECEFSEEESPSTAKPSEKQTYHSPTIDIYRDMQDLLALDPPMPGLRTIPWRSSE